MTTDRIPLAALEHGTSFADRHVGPRPAELARMLDVVGVGSLDELADRAIPSSIRDHTLAELAIDLPVPATETEALAELRALAATNRPMVQMIGLGYHGTITPPVIRRNVLESPAWYTAYTPYQPEISQGRLEALLNFQTLVGDLTGLPVANASMLDEGTAAAEAMTLLRRAGRSKSDRFVVDADTLPQTIAVIRTRAEPLGIDVAVEDLGAGLPDGQFFGLLLSYPGASGAVRDHEALVTDAHGRGALVVVAADPLALTLLRPPGEIGVDAAVGSTQRFGVPMGFGGPHAGYLAVRTGLERNLPGRLVGVSIDADGSLAYRLALQTREQHIRREKATSNICTAQVLLAVIASMYAVYHGPEGLRAIATRTHRMAATLAEGLRTAGIAVGPDAFFDTVVAEVEGRAAEVVASARERGVNLRLVDADRVAVTCDETTTRAHLRLVWDSFGVSADVDQVDAATADVLEPTGLVRTSDFLTHPVFHRHRSETSLLRYLRSLADKDVALDRSMIPLGSCTMKLNATAEMEPITWPEFAELHPFAPVEDAPGILRIISDLQHWLAEITGYDAVSLQPNAGSQGELAGLLAIRAYHRDRGEQERNICLIPSSAHGTNAASAVMAGMRVVVVRCDDGGNIDMPHLREMTEQHRGDLAAIMITYPSTHGVYEDTVREVCGLVHDAGGQVYVDGANLNALIGLARFGKFGADVSHLNLHKTFCIPHGGGGPGVGPIGVREHLSPFLPNHPLQPTAGPATGVGPVSAAPWGSASILPISWAYVRMMGADGLRRATLTAIAAANYVARRLDSHFPVLYTGRDHSNDVGDGGAVEDRAGFVAHECILDLRPITKATGVTVEDVAKRLADYGLHAPTTSFPVAGTLMVEPTESEDLAELDRFCDAMIAIRQEIDKVGAGLWPSDDNPLHNAPHTAASVIGKWNHPYSRDEAAFPLGTGAPKVWPPVRRIDGAKGDRNLICSCPPMDAYTS
jgi:glycine dehydrogenase